MDARISTHEAVRYIRGLLPEVMARVNEFTKEVLNCRGGRLGSGMGALLEGLWLYHCNNMLEPIDIELAWLGEHRYNDFACLIRNHPWDPDTKEGELFRIESKSMNIAADESKGHFDELIANIDENDQLLVLTWRWATIDQLRLFPCITDQFLGPAREVARLRDELHLARGGTFVDRNQCPDGCPPDKCPHYGEPLNENGKRERKSGPESCRVSATTSFAANFGGLVRMLKTNSRDARGVFRRLRRTSDTAHEYISFTHRNFPTEEFNQYTAGEWSNIATELGINPNEFFQKIDLVEKVRNTSKDYMELLRSL